MRPGATGVLRGTGAQHNRLAAFIHLNFSDRLEYTRRAVFGMVRTLEIGYNGFLPGCRGSPGLYARRLRPDRFGRVGGFDDG